MRPVLRKIIVIFWLALVSGTVSFIFWHTELVYSRPTPVPTEFKNVENGSRIDLTSDFKTASGKPVLVHFFNPDCPCSRFNIRHFKSLVEKYSDKMEFVVVSLSDDKYSETEIQSKFGLDLPISFDTSVAEKCGVISTPQAVILNKDKKLFYRGNYNKSRYCTDAKSDYARMAIDSLLSQNHHPEFTPEAHVAYGCALPGAKSCPKPKTP